MYDELYKAWDNEKKSEEIQGLPKKFYVKLASYMKEIRKEGRMIDQKSTRAKLIKHEFQNAKTMIEELVQLRFEKAMKNVMNKRVVNVERLTIEEEELHREILPLIESYLAFSKNIIQGRLSRIVRKKDKKIMVRLTKEIPEFVGPDIKTYGPFKQEDMATLPPENARALIDQGAAVSVETEETR